VKFPTICFSSFKFSKCFGETTVLYGIVNAELLKSFDIENEVYYADID
jgi:hypothetical protein